MTNHEETTEEERMWAMIAHVGQLAGPVVAPALVFAIKGATSSFIKGHAKSALNFAITYLIAYAIGWIAWVFVIFGLASRETESFPTAAIVIFAVLALLALFVMTTEIVASVKAHRGKPFRYPVAIPFFR